MYSDYHYFVALLSFNLTLNHVIKSSATYTMTWCTQITAYTQLKYKYSTTITHNYIEPN